jgi:hypothetical protein
MGLLRRFWNWATAQPTNARCPICRRGVVVPPFRGFGAGMGHGVALRSSELISACQRQHATEHADAEVDAIKRQWGELPQETDEQAAHRRAEEILRWVRRARSE